jgi:hypothetical protein
VVLFERSALSASEQDAIRNAVTSELSLNSGAGDQLQFSPAPEVSAPLPSQAQVAAPFENQASTREAAQAEFMARLNRSWMLALSILTILAAAFVVLHLQRGRHQRRRELADRIRHQLLLVEGVANAA